MQNQQTFVLTVEHPVAVVCSLFGRLLSISALRLKVDNILSSRKDSDKLWQRTINGLSYLASNDLATAFYLVPIGISKIVI